MKIQLLTLILVMFLTVPLGVDMAFSAESDIPLAINELMASNNSSYQDPQNQYDDWIEIYNFGPDTLNIGGMFLTDNLTVPTKWQIPASTTIPVGSFLVIWADEDTTDSGLHANFKLDVGGEEIGLFDTDGVTLIDSIVYPEQTTDISFGRYPDANEDLRFFYTPTPGGKNKDAYIGEVEAPQFSHNRGFYKDPFMVTIATETEGAVIYYTLDGSEPYVSGSASASGSLYTSPILVMGTTCLRAQAIKPGWKPSELVTKSYIFLEDAIRQSEYPQGFPTSWGSRRADYAMDQRVVDDPAYSNEIIDDLKSTPSVCIVIPNDDFFGSGGIYANPTLTGDQWERAASIEWIDPNTGDNFGVNAGLRIHGGPYSRGGTPKNALKIIFRSQYGLSKLDFPLFPDTEVESFNSLALRSIWNYSWHGHSGMGGPQHADYLRDAFARDTIRDMGNLTPHGRTVQVYINGLYWGMYIMTERSEEHFAADHLGGNSDDYDVLEAPSGLGASTTMDIVSGGEQARQAWNTLFDIANNDLSTSEWYDSIQAYIDIPTMIDYMLMIYYVGSRDAPVFLGDSRTPRNFYVIRNREPAEPYIIVPWDTEWALEEPTVNRVNVVGVVNPHYLVDRLLANADFKMLLADHIYRHFYNGGTLTSEQTTERYLDRVNEMYGAIVGESARWGDVKRSTPYTRNVDWNGEVSRLVNQYFSGRTDTVLNQLRQASFYPSVSPPEFSVNGNSQYGGQLTDSDELSMVADSGEIYYTLDGSDPRIPGTGGETFINTTIISENATKKALVPTESISEDWKSDLNFDDSSWASGTSGVGYETGSGYQDYFDIDVEAEMYNGNTSCYIRIPFTFENSFDDFDFLMLNIRYDDGFIAYINGIEVARSDNAPSEAAWHSMATGIHDDSQAVVPESFGMFSLQFYMKQGQNILAIHGLNYLANSSDFLISAELVGVKFIPPDEIDISPSAFLYSEPIAISNSTKVKARVRDAGIWSALNEATFAVGPVSDNLRITEIMYNPAPSIDSNDPNEEFIELTNIGSETINLNLVKFTNGVDFTFPDIQLAPGEYVLVVEDIEAFETVYGSGLNVAGQYTGRLNNNGEKICLEDAIGQIIHEFSYSDNWRWLTDNQGFSLTIIDSDNPDSNSWSEKDSWRPSAYIGGSPGEDDSGIVPDPGAIVINEVLSHSHAAASDWIELYNTTGSSINIGGWYLSDSDTNLTKYKIASGTTIAAGDYKVFYENLHFNNPGDPGSNEGFALSEDGDSVYLNSAEGNTLTGYRQVEDFGASQTDVSFGRYYKESTDNYNFVSMSEKTEGSANSYPLVGPVVISEIMYNPSWPDWPMYGSYTNDQYEYIELYNISDAPVTLCDVNNVPWKFTEGIDFTFPSNVPVTIPTGGYLLIVRHVEAFTWRYPEVSADKILGPYDGKLNNAGDRVELGMPGDLDAFGKLQYIRVDRVEYSDGLHPEDCPGNVDLWPVEADGGGESLTRVVLSEYGNDPVNWIADTPSPAE